MRIGLLKSPLREVLGRVSRWSLREIREIREIGGGGGGWIKVRLFIFHVQSAHGTEQRLARAACAPSNQTLHGARRTCKAKRAPNPISIQISNQTESRQHGLTAGSLMLIKTMILLVQGSEKDMKTEETERPTYQSYSSIPIEQESGPRAAQCKARGEKENTSKQK